MKGIIMGEAKELEPQEEPEEERYAIRSYLETKQNLQDWRKARASGMEKIRQAKGKADKITILDYNKALEAERRSEGRLAERVGDLKREGWVLNKRGGLVCQIKLKHSPTTENPDRKLFEVLDTYGESPVSKGQTMIAQISQAHLIPEQIRDQVIESFTWKGDNAAEPYAWILESEGENTEDK